jgi:flagellar hook-length control protein FliK
VSVHVTDHTSDSPPDSPSTATPNIDALAVSVAARSLGGSKQFDIRLDPPELGRVEVRLSIDASGKTQAHMTADQPQTLELLQKDATNLTRALRDAGLDVSQNGLNFSLKGQSQNGGGQSGNFGGASRGLILPAIAQSIETTQPTKIPYAMLGNARLDIHV